MTYPAVISVHDAFARCTHGEAVELIDVREPDEFAEGHAAHAQNIPLGSLVARKGELDPAKTPLLICRSGGRSGRGVEALAAEGIAALSVSGGMLRWTAEGLG